VLDLRVDARAWPLVGRERQLELIRRALKERNSVVVCGTAGVGKTSLMRNILRRAAADGNAVEWVAATQSSASMPLGAYAHLLPPVTTGYANRALLLSATIRTVIDHARSRPLIVAVDDAHLLDPGSATLTFMLHSTGAARVIATVRRDVASPDAIAALWQKRYAVRIDLESLTRAQVLDVLTTVLGGPVERRTVEWFVDQSAGSPLLIRELVDTALHSHSLAKQVGLWRLVASPPPSSRLIDLVFARLAGVSAAVREVIEFLALAEPIEIEVLADLTSSEALLAAERAGLVTVRDKKIRLVHPLHGELVASQLAKMYTDALLSRLAVALEHRPDPAGTNQIRAAVWRLEVGQKPAPDLLVAAAQEANRRFDNDLAVRLASAALTTGAGTAASLALATALARSNRFASAEDVLAPLELEMAGQPEALGYLQLRVANLHEGLGRTDDASAQLDRATSWSGGSWPSQVEALRVPLLIDEGRLRDAAALGRRLITDPANPPDVVALAGAPTSLALTLTGSTREAEALADQLMQRSADAGPAEVRWLPVQAWVAARLRSGRNWDELAPRISTLHADAVADHDEVLAGLAELTLGRIALTQGDLDAALRWIREAAVHLEAADPRRALVASLALLATIHALRGDPAAARAARAQADAVIASQRSRWWGLIELALSDILLAAAEGELSRARHEALAHAAAAGEAVVNRALFLHVAIRVGTPASQVAAPLGEIAAQTDADLVGAYAAHAAALAKRDAAKLEAISARFEQIGSLLLAMQAAGEAAQEHRHAARDASARRAALRAQQLVKRCPGAPLPALPPLRIALLTPREEEVAGLAARGLSNADIAARLVLSVRSVESHVYRAMHKLGVETRHDLPLGG
jgi:DNA-binding NarL/FixJ family response regulator